VRTWSMRRERRRAVRRVGTGPRGVTVVALVATALVVSACGARVGPYLGAAAGPVTGAGGSPPPTAAGARSASASGAPRSGPSSTPGSASALALAKQAGYFPTKLAFLSYSTAISAQAAQQFEYVYQHTFGATPCYTDFSISPASASLESDVAQMQADGCNGVMTTLDVTGNAKLVQAMAQQSFVDGAGTAVGGPGDVAGTEGVTVVRTGGGRYYHDPACPVVRNRAERAHPLSPGDTDGLAPCRICRPPDPGDLAL